MDNTNSANAGAAHNAPSREQLIETAISAIMALTEEEKRDILPKYFKR